MKRGRSPVYGSELAPDEHHERGDEGYETPYDHDEGVMQVIGLGHLSEIHGTGIESPYKIDLC
jgi:hypothetical protein